MPAPESPEIALREAFGLYRARQFAAAIEKARWVSEKHPHAAPAWYLEGLCELARDDPAEAARALERAVELAPAESTYIESLAIASLRLHRYATAADHLESLCRLAPTADRHLLLGRARWRAGNYPGALAAFRDAAATSDRAEAATALAKALQSLGRRAEAGQTIAAALERWPQDPDLNIAAGVDRFRDDAPSLAIDAFAAAVRLAPGHPLAQCLLGISLAFAGRENEAADHLGRAGTDPRTAAKIDAFRYMQSEPAQRYFGVFTDTLTFALAQAAGAGMALEFGVYHGRSINIIARHWRGQVHGFDTFAGLPQDWNDNNPSGSYSTGGNLPTVADNVSLHRGLFADTLPMLLDGSDEPVAFAHIDCDLYESALSALEPIAPRLRTGSILLFDEFFGYDGWRDHEFRALTEIRARFDLRLEPLAYSLFDKQAAFRLV